MVQSCPGPRYLRHSLQRQPYRAEFVSDVEALAGMRWLRIQNLLHMLDPGTIAGYKAWTGGYPVGSVARGIPIAQGQGSC